MSEKVDALFAGDLPPPVTDAGGRIKRIRRVLFFAIALDVLGIPCWTSVPGAILTLWVWLTTDADLGAIPEDEWVSARNLSIGASWRF